MSSLSERCGNCYRAGSKSCVPVEIPTPNFSRLDAELRRLSEQEAAADAAEEAAVAALLNARSKKNRLKKQRELLERREKKWFSESEKLAEDLSVLEGRESVNSEVQLLENGLMPGTLSLDWSAFMPSWLEGDPLPDGLEGPSGVAAS